MRQRPLPDGVVPLQLRPADCQAQGQVVLPQVPRGQTNRHEAKGDVPQGTGEVQQGQGGETGEAERMNSTNVFFFFMVFIDLIHNGRFEMNSGRYSINIGKKAREIVQICQFVTFVA